MLKYTPMLNQYLEIKKDYEDCFLFFRLGDFYELFFEDAIKASEILNITLTKKNAGKDDAGNAQKIDMCGVPFHAAQSYVTKLVLKGFKVAICEQTEEPSSTKKIVKREVVRVITAGTITDFTVLDETKNNYIMCIYEDNKGFSLSCADVSTGDFLTTSFDSNEINKVIDEIAKYSPSEIICNEKIMDYSQIENIFNVKLSSFSKAFFDIENCYKTLINHFKIKNLSGFGLEDDSLCIISSGALLNYLINTQKNNLNHISNVKKFQKNNYMVLDISSRKNLELTETIKEKTKKGSLLWILDKTKTPMGARLLRKWVEQPLINCKEINKRLESVSFMKENVLLREDLKSIIKEILDIERICSKAVYLSANARDLLSLRNSLSILPSLKRYLSTCKTSLIKQVFKNLDTLEDLHNLLVSSICEDPPFTIREGNMIKDGYSQELDTLRKAKNEGSTWLLDLEAREKDKTGIKNLKVKYNKVFGYYIEVTNSNLDLIPDYFIRKQTLANCERFVTKELQEIEVTILTADEKIVDLEYRIFCKIRDEVSANISRIQKTSNSIAIIDILQSLGQVAEAQKYCKPKVTESGEIIEIIGGRHPVVENILSETFIPNDVVLDKKENLLNIITGPNMSGKSTYMKQVALITLMAQIGSFVPAQSAKINIVDRIFTRVGASDDLATGQSTFMIEMNEVANIVNNATDKSLLILDEIGRGTSTFDGLSIAWAVLEHIANKIKARTLFATHYHELTSIEGKVDGVSNYCVKVKDDGTEIVFLRNIIKGSAGESYGIHVAKLAGIPFSIIRRANEILNFLTTTDLPTYHDPLGIKNRDKEPNFYYNQKADSKVLFIEELARELKALDLNSLNPNEAFSKLINIKNKISNL